MHTFYECYGIRLNMKEIKRTILELLTGMVLYTVLICIVGCFLVDNKLSFILGVLYGAICSAIMIFHMYYTLNISLEMEPEAAEKREKGMIALRLVIMGVALAIGFFLADTFNTIGVILGILGLKISVYLQLIFHNYIFKNKEKGGVKV